MLIAKAIELFDGQDIIDTLTNAGIAIEPGSLGAPVPLIDAEGNLHLAIAETDLAQTKVLLKDWLA
jgi:hypothetical protein